MIYTRSKIEYGYYIDCENYYLKIQDNATNDVYEIYLNIGSYTRDEFLEMVNSKFIANGLAVDLEYINDNLSLNSVGYTLLPESTAPDFSTLKKEYFPPFLLQSCLSDEDNEELRKPTVNTSGCGVSEIVYFGSDSYIEFNIMYEGKNINCQYANGSIEGLRCLRDLMSYSIRKRKIMFFPDKSSDEYKVLELEKASGSSKGTGYKLSEMYNRGLRDLFETKVLRWRVIENEC